MDRLIEVKVSGNYLRKDTNRAGVQGEANVTTLRITFDESWDGYTKTLTWWDACGENPVVIELLPNLLEDAADSTRIYRCLIPAEPLAVAGWCSFVIDGYIDGKRQRTVEDKLQVRYAPSAEGAGTPAEITPTVIEQLQLAIEALTGDIQLAAQVAYAIEHMVAGVKTLDSGANAYVIRSYPKDNSGKEYLRLEFGIPRGAQGEQGIPGKDGKDGADGQDGAPFTYDMFTAEQLEGLRGADGVGIEDVEITTVLGMGLNPPPDTHTITLHMSDGTEKSFTVKDGAIGPRGEKGADGITPEFTLTQTETEEGSEIWVGIKVGNSSTGKIITVKNGKDGEDGAPGKDGTNGITPHIGTNGNWWLGETDTGVPAAGSGTGGEGVAGKDGVTFHPVVSDDGVLSWTNDGGLDNPEPVDITGPQGEQGPKGEQGPRGYTGEDGERGPAGADGVGIASVGNTISYEDGGVNTIIFTLDNGVKKTVEVRNGSKGSTGETGATGPEGPQGPQGVQGPKGETGATGPQGPAGEDGAPGEDGAAGKDGTTPHIGSNGNWWIGEKDTGIAATGPAGKDGATGPQGPTGAAGKDGATGATGPAGNDGAPGKDGARGTGVLKVTTSTTSASGTGANGAAIKYKIALATVKSEAGVDEVLVGDTVLRSYYMYPVVSVDDSYVYLGAYNSIRGATGAAGATGETGPQGPAGSDANVTAENIAAALGYTPVDKAILSLGIHTDGLIYLFVDGVPVGNGIEKGAGGDVVGYVDADNNIVLTGAVPEGAVYNVKYEMDDGTVIDIGELSLEEAVEVVIVNQIPLSIGSDGQPFNGGQGWKTGYRISGSSGGESAQSGTEVTGFMPCKYGDEISIKNIIDDGSHVVGFYSNSYAYLAGLSIANIFGGAVDGAAVTGAKLDGYLATSLETNKDTIAFMRLSATEITADSIITVNQPIE